MDKNLRQYVAELVGTFALVYLAAGTVCSTFLPEPVKLDVLGIALAQGLILAAMLSATMHVSGGYLNPAVTLTLWVFKRMEGGRAIGLAASQVLGALLAGLCLRFTFTQQVLYSARAGTPHLNMQLWNAVGAVGATPTMGQLMTGIGVELILTFILTFAIFGAIIDPRGPRLGGLGAGLALVAGTLMAYGITGAAANPARWLGTVAWEMTLTTRPPAPLADHLIYWIGPIAGALLAGLVYFVLVLPEEPTPTRTETVHVHAPVPQPLVRGKK